MGLNELWLLHQAGWSLGKHQELHWSDSSPKSNRDNRITYITQLCGCLARCVKLMVPTFSAGFCWEKSYWLDLTLQCNQVFWDPISILGSKKKDRLTSWPQVTISTPWSCVRHPILWGYSTVHCISYPSCCFIIFWGFTLYWMVKSLWLEISKVAVLRGTWNKRDRSCMLVIRYKMCKESFIYVVLSGLNSCAIITILNLLLSFTWSSASLTTLYSLNISCLLFHQVSLLKFAAWSPQTRSKGSSLLQPLS